MKNHELLGLRCELAGLLIILIATVWQGAFTDWFDKNSRDWVAYIQEDVNLAVLGSLNDLSRQLNENDPEKRRATRMEIYDRTADAMSKAIQERDRRSALDRGQAALFGKVRYAFLALGALLILFGKWLVLQHKKVSSASVPPSAP